FETSPFGSPMVPLLLDHRTDEVVVDVVPFDLVAHAGTRGQMHVAVGVDAIDGVPEVGVRGVVVDAGGEESLLVVLRSVLGRGAAHLQIAPAGHVHLAPEPVGLGDDGGLACAGDAAAYHVDAAHV